MVAYSQIAGKHVVSYSKLEDLHSCPRKFELLNILNANPVQGGEDNIDFMFGHAVGTGVQMLKAGLSIDEAILYASLEWKADIYAIMPRKKKSFYFALHAVRVAVNEVLPIIQDYDIFEWTGDDGVSRSGIETYFRLELANGKTMYEGHIDLLCIHKTTRKLAVFEIKTNAFSMVHEATYSNSYQVDGYSLFCAALQHKYGEKYNIAPSESIDVRYIIFKVPSQDYEFMPLSKSYRHWNKFWKDIHSDIEVLDKYENESNYPCRGGACYDYFRPCFFFGTCHYPNHRFASYNARFEDAPEEPETFAASEIVSLLDAYSIPVQTAASDGVVNPRQNVESGLESFDL